MASLDCGSSRFVVRSGKEAKASKEAKDDEDEQPENPFGEEEEAEREQQVCHSRFAARAHSRREQQWVLSAPVTGRVVKIMLGNCD
jgi:hypothetical protein